MRAQVAALQRALREGLALGMSDLAGPERFHLGWRRDSDSAELGVAVISHWGSAEAAARADAERTSPLAIARVHLGEVEVAHFEVDETIRRSSAAEPIALRIATGRFSKPGADADMQNLLRQRAPGIGDEMTEAWVG